VAPAFNTITLGGFLMKRAHLLGMLLVPMLVVGITTLPGCTKPKEEVKKDDTAKGDGKGDGAKDGKGGGKTETLEAKTDGVIKGKVVFDGTPPKMEELPFGTHDDKKICLMGADSEKHKQEWIVGGGNGVANVVIWLDAPKGKSFKITDETVKDKANEEPVLDQPHCAFVPHIVAMYTGSGKNASGQQLLIKNSSKVGHNTKVEGDERAGNSPFNKNLNPGESVKHVIKFQKTPLAVKCDKHSWMNAEIITFDQPYFAVTDKDGGFTIKNVPSGTDLTVRMWHESFGALKEATSESKKFAAGDNTLDLKIKAK